MKNNKFKIKIAKDGPYEINGEIPLIRELIKTDKEGFPVAWEKVKEYQMQNNYRLCRCGYSKNKPYCDESHFSVNFDGTETADNRQFENKANTIEGPDLILKDLPELCATARFCDYAGGIWSLTKKSNDLKSKQTAIREACDCPSGRLVVRDKKTALDIEPEIEQSISIVDDPSAGVAGPIWVKGGIPVESADGEKYEIRNRMTLCRCGKARNKPFCDGTHIPIKFKDE